MTFLKVISTGSQKGNCYAIYHNNEILLLDCGCEYKKILKGIDFQISKVVGCIVTHIHGDHVKAYSDLMKNGIQIYTNDETAENMEIVLGEKAIGIPENKLFKIGNFSIAPMYLPHDNTPNFGYLIYAGDRKVLYATDFAYMPYKFTKIGITDFLIEVNHDSKYKVDNNSAKFKHVLAGHSSLPDVLEIFKINCTDKTKNIVACHLSSENASPDYIKEEIEKISMNATVNIAVPGLEII